MTFGPCCEKAEQWRSHPALPDYSVSTKGGVRRDTPGKGTRAGRILAPYVNTTGHLMVHMTPPNGEIFRGWRGPPSKKPKYQVARLVMAVWGKGHPGGDWADLRWRLHHKDENPEHNCIENLEWLSQSDHKKLHHARRRERQGE